MSEWRMPAYYVQEDDKYRLDSQYKATTRVEGFSVETAACTLEPTGRLILKRGFTWNGPSGPAVDTPRTMIPSAIHDCLYGLIEAGDLPNDARKDSDKTYREALRNWGVSGLRRGLHFRGVRLFGWLHV